MDHNEATQQMVAERYLLGELTPELRDAFEEHAFDCPECSVDLRAGATFIGAAKSRTSENRRGLRSGAEARDLAGRQKRRWIGKRGCVRPSPFPFLPHCWHSLPTRTSIRFPRSARRRASRACSHRQPSMPARAGQLTLQSKPIARRERYFRLNFHRNPAIRLLPLICTILKVNIFGRGQCSRLQARV